MKAERQMQQIKMYDLKDLFIFSIFLYQLIKTLFQNVIIKLTIKKEI